MKFAIAIALFVLGQCIIADAWYVSCRRFHNERNHDRNDRSSLNRYADDLNRQSHDINSRISSLYRRLNSIEPSLRSKRTLVDGQKRESQKFTDYAKLQRKRLDDQSRQLDVYDKVTKCAFDKNNMLMCLIVEFFNA